MLSVTLGLDSMSRNGNTSTGSSNSSNVIHKIRVFIVCSSRLQAV